MLLLVLDLILLSFEVDIDHIIFMNFLIVINIAFMTEEIFLLEVQIDTEGVIASFSKIIICWFLIIELYLVNSSGDDTSHINIGEVLN